MEIGRRDDIRIAFQFVNCYFFHMSMKKWILVFCVVVWIGCEGGLSPMPAVKPGISGAVYFAKGSWPGTPLSPDSLSNLWIFASQVYPLDSSLVFKYLISNPPRIFLYPSIGSNLPFYVDTLAYVFNLPVGIYKYVGVIQHISPEFNIRTLRVVGVARDHADTAMPAQVQVIDGALSLGININVDFHNPPAQPF